MIPESIRSLFRKTPVEKVVDDELHQARLDLLNAQANAEHWNGAVTTLKRRVARLQGHEAVVAADTLSERLDEQTR